MATENEGFRGARHAMQCFSLMDTKRALCMKLERVEIFERLCDREERERTRRVHMKQRLADVHQVSAERFTT